MATLETKPMSVVPPEAMAAAEVKLQRALSLAGESIKLVSEKLEERRDADPQLSAPHPFWYFVDRLVAYFSPRCVSPAIHENDRQRFLVLSCLFAGLLHVVPVTLFWNYLPPSDPIIALVCISAVGFLSAPFLLKYSGSFVWSGMLPLLCMTVSVTVDGMRSGGIYSHCTHLYVIFIFMSLLVAGRLASVFALILTIAQSFFFLSTSQHGDSVAVSPPLFHFVAIALQQIFSIVLVLYYDRTLRDRLNSLEQANKRAEAASKSKSDFLATMSHELRTPLNGLVGMTKLLMGTKMDDDQEEYLQTISKCAEALLSLINDILDFTKIESNKMEMEVHDFSIPTVVDNVLDIIGDQAYSQGLEVAACIHSSVPVVCVGDSWRLQQILLNLTHNAIKFSPAGEVTIEVNLVRSLFDEPEGTLSDTAIENAGISPVSFCDRLVDTSSSSSSSLPEYLRFTVSDTGCGMSLDALKRLFEPFTQAESSTTRKYGGTGLGLSICKRLVEMMGGRIAAVSKEGVGSKFYFVIPLVRSVTGTATCGSWCGEPDSISLTTALPLVKSSAFIVSSSRAHQILSQRVLHCLGFTDIAVCTKLADYEETKNQVAGKVSMVILDLAVQEEKSYWNHAMELSRDTQFAGCCIALLVSKTFAKKIYKHEHPFLCLTKPLRFDVALSLLRSRIQEDAATKCFASRESTDCPDWNNLPALRSALISESTRDSSFSDEEDSNTSETEKPCEEAPAANTHAEESVVGHSGVNSAVAVNATQHDAPPQLDLSSSKMDDCCSNSPRLNGGSHCDGVTSSSSSSFARVSHHRQPSMSDCPSGGASPAASIASFTSSVMMERAQKVVLVVDDNFINQKLMTHVLKKLGYSFLVAWNGKEAVDMFRSRHIDLILMDCMMPQMDGFEACKCIRAMGNEDKSKTEASHVPIVALTASAMKGDKEKCLAVGMDAYITKPINMEQLEDMLNRFLG